MILLTAIVIGLLVGVGRARWQHRPYRAPELKFIWLAVAAFIPQLIVGYVPATRDVLPDWLVGVLLSTSLIAFLAFIWINRRLPGMPVLFVGMALNLLVMLANGGWMPISPATASHLAGAGGVEPSSLGNVLDKKMSSCSRRIRIYRSCRIVFYSRIGPLTK